jgi:leader peptidase (prepilin peptidase)/N-methyltransferase
MIYWLNLIVAALLGMAVGSFLNVVSDRVPSGQSLVSPPSHCPVCHRRLSALDMVPIVSYLALRGRCRSCSAQIPLRILIVELSTSVLFALIWARYGWSYQGVAMMGYASLFLVVFIIDLEHRIIPNKLVLVGLVAALGISSFWPDIGPVSAVIGAAAGFGILLALYLIPGAVIGEGDVKLAAVVGAATGFPVVIVGLGLSFIMGGLVAITLIAFRRGQRKSQIPFGPFIAVAAMIALVCGETIFRWYAARFLSF